MELDAGLSVHLLVGLLLLAAGLAECLVAVVLGARRTLAPKVKIMLLASGAMSVLAGAGVTGYALWLAPAAG